MRSLALPASAILLLLAPHAPPAGTAPRPRAGFVRQVRPETPERRDARRRLVAERRAGPVVICHRGAAAFAPENTLEACAAALDYGADGCEVDVRRTLDGVIVLFHDDMLDQLTDGFGTVDRFTYYELLGLKPRRRYGGSGSAQFPTFAALLELARSRAMLLHLDVKQTGLDRELAGMLEAADAWEHVVAVNRATAPELADDPRLRLLSYRGPGLYAGRRDLDPEAVRAQLARPGEMIMVDDPRVAARELGRPGYRPARLPDLREPVSPPAVSPPAGGDPFRELLADPLPTGQAELLACLAAGPVGERTRVDGSEAEQALRTRAILRRALAAQLLGGGGRSRGVVRALELQVMRRSLHRDWMFHGLDGAAAARALGNLRSTASAPVLVDAFRRIDPALAEVTDPRFRANPLAWTDFRTKMYILPALGEMRCAAGEQFLWEYLALDETRARELAPVLFEDAARALMRHALDRNRIERLLRSPHAAVRGTALIECLDRPSRERTAALAAVAPWALELPRARR